jgi:hypothetical protein
MAIRAGTITAIYLFDVAEQIDLSRLRDTIATGSPGRVTSKATAPAYLHYQTPRRAREAPTRRGMT